MAVEIKVPRMGMAVADVTLTKWKVKEGDHVQKNDAIAIIESEKLTSDVECPCSGFIHILLNEGDTASPGQVLALVAESVEEFERLRKESPQPKTPNSTEASQANNTIQHVVSEHRKSQRIERGKVAISPIARKLAEEHNLDITTIDGTGPGGRITRDDILTAIAAQKMVTPVDAYQGIRVKMTIPLKGMRKRIADNMHHSLSVAAQLTTMGEIDMASMVSLRNELILKENVLGTRITYTDLFVFVLSRVLNNHPLLNSSLIDNEIKIWEDINIGVAVAIDDGLIVPVVKNADRKSLVEISQTIKTLTQKARSGQLVLDEVTGGTFTLSNVGALGGRWTFETPILNHPESAIIRTSAITDRVVAREGQIVIRPIATCSLTYDHRVIDGAVAARFMTSVISAMENPGLLLV